MKKLIFLLTVLLAAPTAFANQVLPDGLSVDAQIGTGVMSTSLEGDGFAGDLTSSKARAYGAEIGRNWASGFKLRFKYNYVFSDFDPPATVTPAIVRGSRTEYMIYGLINPSNEGWLEHLWLGLGYSMLRSEFDESSPAIATTQVSRGLNLLGNFDYWFNDRWGMSVFGSIYLPHDFSEKKTNTGFNSRYVGFEIAPRAKFRWREDFYLYTGLRYRRDAVGFDGTGSRGVTGGQDLRSEMIVPFGFNFDY